MSKRVVLVCSPVDVDGLSVGMMQARAERPMRLEALQTHHYVEMHFDVLRVGVVHAATLQARGCNVFAVPHTECDELRLGPSRPHGAWDLAPVELRPDDYLCVWVASRDYARQQLRGSFYGVRL